MNFIRDDSGIAYTIITVFIALIIGAVLFMAFQEVITPLVIHFNEGVVEGTVTENSANTTDTILTLFELAVPFFIIIAIVEYAVIKAIEKKKHY